MGNSNKQQPEVHLLSASPDPDGTTALPVAFLGFFGNPKGGKDLENHSALSLVSARLPPNQTKWGGNNLDTAMRTSSRL